MSFYVGRFEIDNTIICDSKAMINGTLVIIKTGLLLKNGTTSIADISVEVSNVMKIRNIKLLVN